MIIDKDITISINGSNRIKYEKITGRELKNKDKITVKQTEILPTTRIKVDCQCDICAQIFQRTRVNIKTDVTTCNTSCRNEWLKQNNPNPTKAKVPVNCSNCNKSFEVPESVFNKQEHHLCSRDCYSEHRKTQYYGDKIYNYQGETASCATCGVQFKTSKWFNENRKHQFCSRECYLDNYSNLYYSTHLNDARKESVPEEKVRAWLESKGLVKGLDFYQEQALLRKYFADFYIPKYDLILEVYGDYWHVNPSIYNVDEDSNDKRPMSAYQSKSVVSRRDLKRQHEIEFYDYNFRIIWEQEINDDIDKYMSIIFDNIKESSNDYT